MLYIVAPNTPTGKLMRKPFMKFLIHASSYLFFLLILILVSQRVEDIVIELFGSENWRKNVIEKYEKQRGNPPMILEYVVFAYVIGFIVEEMNEMYMEGISDYLRNMWNIIDFTRNSLYTAVIVLRTAAYIEQNVEISENPATAYLRREEWAPFDFQLVAEGLFAAANIFSAIKLVHLFSINPHLGPLQISLGRMVIDIVKFFFIYSLVLFAFACGLNQLLWYFSDLERQKCFHLPNGSPDFDNFSDSCMKWRRFANVFESSQSLFWASFGLVDLSSFELTGIKTYTRFWGLLMFGSYSVINVIVLLNLLIAMMSNSYAIIDEHSDTEWKFARTKLWMSYFEETATLPPPFNIIPTPKMFLKFLGFRKKDKLRRLSTKRRNREEKERDYKYSAVMRALVWRYVAAMHKKDEENPVTEDDVSELKSDISSFRYEIMEVLHRNGMDVSSAEREEKAIFGKKNKVWERRLLKDFKVGPIATEDDEEILYAPPPDNETATARFRRIAKMAILNSGMNKWRQVVKGACIASQIGHCHNRDSFVKQQNLQKAMTEAKRLAAKSPSSSRSITPIHLPDISGSNIMDIIADIKGVTKSPSNASSFLLSSVPIPTSKSDLLLENQKMSSVLNAESTSNNFKYILSEAFVPSDKLGNSSRVTSPLSFIQRPFESTVHEDIEGMSNKIENYNSKMTRESSEDSSTGIALIKTMGVVRDNGHFEIDDVLDTSTLIYTSGMVHPEKLYYPRTTIKQCRSPKLTLTTADEECISHRHQGSSKKQFPEEKVSVDESGRSYPSESEVRSHLPHSKVTVEPEPERHISPLTEEKRENVSLLEKNIVNEPILLTKIPQELLKPEMEKSVPSQPVDVELHPLSITNLEDEVPDSNNREAYVKNVSDQSSLTTNSKNAYNKINTEENIQTEKPKLQSVSFSLLDDKIEETADLITPISPEKSTMSPEFQTQSHKITASTSLSPDVSRSQSSSETKVIKSPLALKNIHRVKKNYQPKSGWL
ncbi:hypothetical protein WA026_006275 [Henosepilachna vigintioctopunctata]